MKTLLKILKKIKEFIMATLTVKKVTIKQSSVDSTDAVRKDDLDTAVGGVQTSINNSVNTLTNLINETNISLSNTGTMLNNAINSVANSVDTVNSQVNRVSGIVDGVVEDINNINSYINNIRAEIVDLDDKITNLEKVDYDIFRRRVIIVGQDMSNEQYNEYWDGNTLRELHSQSENAEWTPVFSVSYYNTLMDSYKPAGVGCHYTDIYEAITAEMKKPVHHLDGGTTSLIIIHKPNENISIHCGSGSDTESSEEFQIMFAQFVGEEAIVDGVSFENRNITLVSNYSGNGFWNFDFKDSSSLNFVGVKFKNGRYYGGNINFYTEGYFGLINCDFVGVDRAYIHAGSIGLSNITYNGQMETILYGGDSATLSVNNSYIKECSVGGEGVNYSIDINNSIIERSPNISISSYNVGATLNIYKSRVFADMVAGYAHINIDDITDATTSDFNKIHPTGSALFSPNISYFIGE